jgi:hypothetical protein
MRNASLVTLLPALALATACTALDPAEGDTGATDTAVADTGTPRPDVIGADTGSDGTEADTGAGDDVESDTGVADTGADTADTAPDTLDDAGSDPDAPDTAADTAPDVPADTGADSGTSDCAEGATLYSGVHIVDRNGDPLEVGDVLDVTVGVLGSGSGEAGELVIETWSVDIDPSTVDAAGFTISGSSVSGPRLTVQSDALVAGELTFEATVSNDAELTGVMVTLLRESCRIPRSRSGAVLQTIGGGSKIPFCIDAGDFRSLQVAPFVAKRSTAQYGEANGVRADLMAEDFIFCPESPKIVHQAEMCIRRAPGQPVTLAGSFAGGGRWEVDDFALFESRDRGALVADGFTTQRHPGGPTFWCGALGEPDGHLCPSGCTASLRVQGTNRVIEPLAVTESLAPTLRRFDDGAVSIARLLPDDGRAVDLTVTALDVGVEGTLNPGLYLTFGEPAE